MDRSATPTSGKTAPMVAASASPCCARMPGVLSAAGLHVTVLAPEKSPALASSHVARRIRSGSDVLSVLKRLRSLIAARGAFDFIVIGDEEAMRAVASCSDEPWARRCLPFPPDARAVDIATSKNAFVLACRDACIAVPEFGICETFDDARRTLDRIGVPAVAKAAFGSAGSSVHSIDDVADVACVLSRMDGKPFVVQRRIAGEAGVTEMLCDRGRPIAVASSLMHGIDPAPFGPASAREFIHLPQARALAGDIARLTGFHGFCGFDWIREGGPGGPLRVLEFHHRPTLGIHLARHAGVDFAAALAGLLAGTSSAEPQQNDAASTHCLLFPKDLTRAFRSGDAADLLRWLPGRAKTDFPWTDPGLLWHLAKRFLRARAADQALTGFGNPLSTLSTASLMDSNLG